MSTLKLVWTTFVQLAGQVRRLPQDIVNAAKQRRRQAAEARREAERIDRICNPLKYRGK